MLTELTCDDKAGACWVREAHLQEAVLVCFQTASQSCEVAEQHGQVVHRRAPTPPQRVLDHGPVGSSDRPARYQHLIAGRSVPQQRLNVLLLRLCSPCC